MIKDRNGNVSCTRVLATFMSNSLVGSVKQGEVQRQDIFIRFELMYVAVATVIDLNCVIFSA